MAPDRGLTAAELVSDLTELEVLAVVAAVALAVLLVLRRWYDAVFLVVAVGVVWAVNPLLKQLIARPRPVGAPADVSEYSFPSGHAANTAALAGALVLIVGHRLLSVLLGLVVLLLVGWSQLTLERHYLTDLLAGWFWALLWVGVVRYVTKGGPK
ncbi:phosphatase PAP2 family protein [Kribbella sp. HUAS MG21]|uniref:Phosphatase PAP2 family protein n=1 Tax=Kribbella sp. HUAS MG21 TaxID=3160966 RepID=A0AAU7TNW2_9ACTN